ncbi:hypothetical protein E2C01_035538 [Portunus trituberculatus]|uniref:Uncharacterized protein n=1 Tax=Portunus trituberculatus TaxID=210409 RepID=A0A5B7F8Q3_PORTR|nr:hypothetical protein [Portunus trituberculatus]
MNYPTENINCLVHLAQVGGQVSITGEKPTLGHGGDVARSYQARTRQSDHLAPPPPLGDDPTPPRRRRGRVTFSGSHVTPACPAWPVCPAFPPFSLSLVVPVSFIHFPRKLYLFYRSLSTSTISFLRQLPAPTHDTRC